MFVREVIGKQMLLSVLETKQKLQTAKWCLTSTDDKISETIRTSNLRCTYADDTGFFYYLMVIFFYFGLRTIDEAVLIH